MTTTPPPNYLARAYDEYVERDLHGNHTTHVEAYFAWHSNHTPGDGERFLLGTDIDQP